VNIPVLKFKLFDRCGTAVVNADNEYGKRAAGILKNEIITYGIENKSDVYAKDIKIDESGSSFTLCIDEHEIPIKLNLPGKFNVYNALGCAAAALTLGIDPLRIKAGLEGLKKVPGRSEKINSKRGFTVVIDYAHTPDGIENILKTAREYTKNRLVTVFGCGGDRDKTKRPIMGKAAGELSDFCIVTSDNPRSEEPIKIIEDILPGINETKCEYIILENRREAIEYALNNAHAGDVIIIAGKGHENYQVLKDRTIHFDEREIVLQILGEDAVV
jgi:UDP-N-acetylmuramyl-tripeptide synthetase